MQKTASGLEWGFLKKGGDEPRPGVDDVVEVHYTGWLTDGTKFDSSRDRGQPASFPVSGVIKGWTEGLQLMTPGARCKLVIPGDLAYGAAGSPPKIPANATLVFDVELLKVTRMPKFRPASPDAQKSLASGVKYEVVKVGTGAECIQQKGVALRFAIWSPEGKLLECSEQQRNFRITGLATKLDFVFLTELIATCKVGDVLRVEVPQKEFPQAQKDTVWELEVSDVPAFRALDAAKTVTTQSGIQYEVIEQGTGASPGATDTVKVHYSGWLTDGTMFDSSHARGESIEFPLNRVIKGWTEGVQLMKKGGKFLFSIPGNLAYGAAGQPPKIGANATLMFLVELIDIKQQ
jgi:FKBP-type peptidyl-prolyl cis-trans isomerase